MTQPNDVDAALWMLAQLSTRTQEAVRRRLALRVDAPIPIGVQRRRDLALAVQLLAGGAPAPGWSFPTIPRSEYDAQRTADSPASGTLVERYGSWITVCYNAHQLALGRNRLRGHAGPHARHYSDAELVEAVAECANQLNRPPSSSAYQAWYPAARRRRRHASIPCLTTIERRFAEQGGWVAALEKAELVTPPPNTVRISTRNRRSAEMFAREARRVGLVAAHNGRRRWVEVQGTLTDVKLWAESHPRLFVETTIAWEPYSNTRLDLR